MSKRILQTLKVLRKLERERARILEDLLITEPLLKGSLSYVKRTCGKPNCHCAQEPAHEAWVLATSLRSKRRCQVVRQADVEQVRRRVGAYKNFRGALRRLATIEKEQRALLCAIMEDRHVPYK